MTNTVGCGQAGMYYQCGYLFRTLPVEIDDGELHRSCPVVLSTALTHLLMICLSLELNWSSPLQEHLRIHYRVAIPLQACS